MFLAATRVYSGYKSFALSANDTIAETAQWQLFLTMFATLAIRDNYDGGGAYFDALMIMLQCIGVIMGLFKYLYWKSTVVYSSREAEKEVAENSQQQSSRGGGTQSSSPTNWSPSGRQRFATLTTSSELTSPRGGIAVRDRVLVAYEGYSQNEPRICLGRRINRNPALQSGRRGSALANEQIENMISTTWTFALNYF